MLFPSPFPKRYQMKATKIFLITGLLFFSTLFLAAKVFAACCECYIGGVGTTCCGYTCGTGTDPTTPSDPSCNCSSTQCCQADGSCGPCGGSGTWKGVHARFFIDNYTNNPTFPSLVWNAERNRMWTKEDRVPAFEKTRTRYFPPPYTGDVTAVFWGLDSRYSSEDGEDGYDQFVVLSKQTDAIDKSIDWSGEGYSDALDYEEHKRVSIVSYPSYLKTAGVRPPGLYTIEPAASNMTMSLTRQYRSGEPLVPINKAYVSFKDVYTYFGDVDETKLRTGYYPCMKVNCYYLAADQPGITLTTNVLTLPEGFSNAYIKRTYRCDEHTLELDEQDPYLYYSKLNESTGVWSGWTKITGKTISLSAGQYKLKGRFRMEGPGDKDGWCSWMDLTFVTKCQERLEPLTGKLLCIDNSTYNTTNGRFIRPEDSNLDTTTFYVPNSPWQINYTFAWNFRPNFNGTAQIRILKSNVSAGAISTLQLYRLNADGTKTDISGQITATKGASHNSNPASYRLTMTGLNTAYNYQLRMGGYARNAEGEAAGYFTTNFFSFLFANEANHWSTMGNCTDLTCAWIKTLGVENGSDYMFIPFIDETPTTGTIIGNVYQDNNNTCSGTTTPDNSSAWSVQSKLSSAADSTYVACNKTDSSYSCPNLNQGSSYSIRLSTDTSVYLPNSCSSQVKVVALTGDSSPATPFYVWNGGEAWYQTAGGDVASLGSISDLFPATGSFMDTDTDYSAGVVAHNGSVMLGLGGSGTVSATNWLAGSRVSTTGIGYATLKSIAGGIEEDNFTSQFDGDLSNLSGSSEGVYLSLGDVTIDQENNIGSSKKLVIFVNGNVTINDNIQVAKGSFLAIIASGDISVASSVTSLEGVYIVDGEFTTVKADPSPDVQFTGRGIFIANKFNLNRDLGAVANATTPAEKFIFRPDLVMNASSVLWQAGQFWQEVAP